MILFYGTRNFWRYLINLFLITIVIFPATIFAQWGGWENLGKVGVVDTHQMVGIKL